MAVIHPPSSYPAKTCQEWLEAEKYACCFLCKWRGNGCHRLCCHTHTKDFKWMPETNSPGPLSLFFCLTTLYPPSGVLDAPPNILRMIFKPNTFQQVWNGCLCEIEMSLKEKMKFAHVPLQPGLSSELLDSEDNSPYFSVFEV